MTPVADEAAVDAAAGDAAVVAAAAVVGDVAAAGGVALVGDAALVATAAAVGDVAAVVGAVVGAVVAAAVGALVGAVVGDAAGLLLLQALTMRLAPNKAENAIDGILIFIFSPHSCNQARLRSGPSPFGCKESPGYALT